MEIITGPKGVGKTKQLVQLCMSDQNGVLVVKDVGQMVDRFIAWFGHVPKFEIISYNEYKSHSNNDAQYYFDDFDRCIETLFKGNVQGIVINSNK